VKTLLKLLLQQNAELKAKSNRALKEIREENDKAIKEIKTEIDKALRH